jgi:hypothetical protein
MAGTQEIDGAYLDSKYPNLSHPIKDDFISNKSLPISDIKEVISFQTPVRSQISRGTCSIFSATAYIEGLLIKKGLNPNLDLSEEWLQYVAVRKKSTDGSSAWANFSAMKDFGMPREESFPYIGEDWTEIYNPLKDIRCGKLTGVTHKSCLIVHRDPTLLDLTDEQIKLLNGDNEFIKARKEAKIFKKKNLKFLNNEFFISTVSKVKELLLNDTPVVLEVDFFYGAWNHRKALDYGIGRDLEQWAKGIVAYPEPGSADVIESPKHPAGHSIVIVGFDENKIIEKTIKMKDGTYQNFKYIGVYYFKNSWGTSGFGNQFEIDGESYPGYGMIVAKYAEELGQFFKLTLK